MDPNLEAPLHDCKGILAQVHCIRSDLQDTPLSDVEETWFTDQSRYMRDGQRYAVVAVTMTFKVIWAEAVPPHIGPEGQTNSPNQSLKPGKDKKINICTDSRYDPIHPWCHKHGKRVVNCRRKKTIKNKQEITTGSMAPQEIGCDALSGSPDRD